MSGQLTSLRTVTRLRQLDLAIKEAVSHIVESRANTNQGIPFYALSDDDNNRLSKIIADGRVVPANAVDREIHTRRIIASILRMASLMLTYSVNLESSSDATKTWPVYVKFVR